MQAPLQAPLQPENQSDAIQRTTARTAAQKRVLVDNRPAAMAQRKLAELVNNSPRALQQRALSDAIHNSPHMVAQRHKINALFGGAVQLQEGGTIPAQLSPVQREAKPNNTGLPNQLKSGIESLSGMSMDHVKVHYNSDKPAQLQAHAYAQGSEIHLAPGQEEHLPHEAWHVVQQAQGRVRPTVQMKGGIPVNDDVGLEGEADLMGAKALQCNNISPSQFKMHYGSADVVQRVVPDTQQPTSNTCWAACGFAIHVHFGGSQANIAAFVANVCSAASNTKYLSNQVNDIDDAIGTSSKQNLLTGSDGVGTYGKNGITTKLESDHPIIANVNANHYIILTARTITDGTYNVTYMDPATGQSVTAAAKDDVNSKSKITHVDNYKLSTLYYT